MIKSQSGVALWADLRTAPLYPAAEGKYTLENGQAREKRLRDVGNQNPTYTPSTQIYHPLGPEPTHVCFQSRKTVPSIDHTALAYLPNLLNNRAISEGNNGLQSLCNFQKAFS